MWDTIVLIKKSHNIVIIHYKTHLQYYLDFSHLIMSTLVVILDYLRETYRLLIDLDLC